ncbi:MAG: hypothetical protein U0470_05290 [Anaerolineae bacterium]
MTISLTLSPTRAEVVHRLRHVITDAIAAGTATSTTSNMTSPRSTEVTVASI